MRRRGGDDRKGRASDRPCIIGDGIVRRVALLADAHEAHTGVESVRARIVRVCVHFRAEPLAAAGDIEGGLIEALAEALSARGLGYGNAVDIEQVAALLCLPRFEPTEIGALIGQRAGLDQIDEAKRRAALICRDEASGQINPALQAVCRCLMPHTGRRGLVDRVEGREVSGGVRTDGHGGDVAHSNTTLQRFRLSLKKKEFYGNVGRPGLNPDDLVRANSDFVVPRRAFRGAAPEFGPPTLRIYQVTVPETLHLYKSDSTNVLEWAPRKRPLK